MDRDIKGVPNPEYLWKVKHVVPFLKVDKGLADAAERRADDEADARPGSAPRES